VGANCAAARGSKMQGAAKYLHKNDFLLSTDFKLFNLLARIRGE